MPPTLLWRGLLAPLAGLSPSLCILVAAAWPAAAVRPVNGADDQVVVQAGTGALGSPAQSESADEFAADAHSMGEHPVAAVDKAFVNICIDRMATTFEGYMQEHLKDLAPEPQDKEFHLAEKVVEYEAIYMQLKPNLWLGHVNPFASEETRELKRGEERLKDDIHHWGFSPHKAREVCEGLLSESRGPACAPASLLQAAPPGPTLRTAWEKLVSEGADLAKEENLLEAMIGGAGRVEKLRKQAEKQGGAEAATGAGARNQAEAALQVVLKAQEDWDERKKSRTDALQSRTKEIKAWIDKQGALKYSDYERLVRCSLIKSEQQDLTLAEVAERVDKEVNGPTMEEGGKCVENATVGYCPEGMSPQFQRRITPGRAALWGTTAFFAGGPVGIALGVVGGAAFGFLMGPGVMVGIGLGLAVTGAIPMGVIAAPIAALAGSMDLIPTCRCFDSVCAYDETLFACTIKAKSNSTNPYHWLPFPGQKCVLEQGKCAVKLCGPADFKPEGRADGVYGSVGEGLGDLATDVMNCLSTDGTQRTQLQNSELLPKLLPGGIGGSANTAWNRAKLYEHLRLKPKQGAV